MTDVKRYRKRDIIRGIVDAHRDLYGPELLAQLERELGQQPPQVLAHLFTNDTLREVVYHKCGIFYGIHHQENDQ